LRRAALALRKSRRLRPELVTRVAQWDRQVLAWDAARLRADTTLAPTGPGVYLFRDATGYLYIGEAANLRRRLAEHLDQSDRQSLAHYLSSQGIDQVTVEVHAFDPQSGAKSKELRRAYESELIRSRQPRFNVAP
jgi:excinuclease UvrABC nuclease subunit